MFTMSISVVFMVIWWFGVGPFLLVLNGFAHSETNLLIHWAKREGNSTLKLRAYQVLHCIGYVVWVIGFFSIPFAVKHFLN